MGWKRINGRSYFYKSKRHGGRVKSVYFGRGESDALMAEIMGIERLERVIEREQNREEREVADTEERAITEWFDRGQLVANLAMLAAGFHKHKGQWRRKRR
jgi:hypothetical protein